MPDVIHRYHFGINEVIEAMLQTVPPGVVNITVGAAPDGESIFLDLDYGEANVRDDNPYDASDGEPDPETEQKGPPDAEGSEDVGSPVAGPKTQQAPKGGDLARAAGIMCSEKSFHIFMDVGDEKAAADELRAHCQIDSRAELDHDADAARRFKGLRVDYENWQKE